MTGDAGTPLTAKWQIIELDEAQGIGSVEIEDGFTLIPPSGMPDSRWGFPSGPISDSMW